MNMPAASELVRKLPPPAAADMVEWSPDSSAQQMFADVLDSELDPADYISPAPRVPALAPLVSDPRCERLVSNSRHWRPAANSCRGRLVASASCERKDSVK